VLHAKTTRRKQRVTATATADDLGGDVPNVGIGRALIVILVLHVLAIGAIALHSKWTDGVNYAKAAPAEDIEDSQSALFSKEDREKAGAIASEDEIKNDANSRPDQAPVVPNGQPLIPSTHAQPVAPATDPLATPNPSVETAQPTVPAGQPVLVKPRLGLTEQAPQRAVPVTQPTDEVPKSARSHKVVKGDTLYGICRKYKVSLSALKKANNKANNNIRIGETLKIPAS